MFAAQTGDTAMSSHNDDECYNDHIGAGYLKYINKKRM